MEKRIKDRDIIKSLTYEKWERLFPEKSVDKIRDATYIIRTIFSIEEVE